MMTPRDERAWRKRSFAAPCGVKTVWRGLRAAEGQPGWARASRSAAPLRGVQISAPPLFRSTTAPATAQQPHLLALLLRLLRPSLLRSPTPGARQGKR